MPAEHLPQSSRQHNDNQARATECHAPCCGYYTTDPHTLSSPRSERGRKENTMLFVYSIIEELTDTYGEYTGQWSEPKERADYTYHPNGYEYFFPERHIHGIVKECKRIRFGGFLSPTFSLAEIIDAINYAAEHDLGEETMILIRVAHELGIDTAPSPSLRL